MATGRSRRRWKSLQALILAAVAILGSVASGRGQAPDATGSGPAPIAPAGSASEASPAGSPGVAPSYYAGEGAEPEAPRVEMGLLDTIAESLTGDAYAAGRWRSLGLRNFFREGWLEPWAGGPAGRDGLTPRHGWLGAFDGVFYRLNLVAFSDFQSINAPYHGNRYSGVYSIFLPFSRRFNLLIDTPFVVSNGTKPAGQGYASAFGDLTITPRFLLAENEATTQVFAVGVRTPTGSRANSNGVMSLTPRYEFWTNPGGRWVVRGSGGVFVPLNVDRAPEHTSFTGGLAVGR